MPGTVFSSYVRAGLEKEPTYGDNITKVDQAKYDRDFWYRTEFIGSAPKSIAGRAGKLWLNSGGSLPSDVNVYRANAIEKIKQVRSHACVALWCGENEGDPPAPLKD